MGGGLAMAFKRRLLLLNDQHGDHIVGKLVAMAPSKHPFLALGSMDS